MKRLPWLFLLLLGGCGQPVEKNYVVQVDSQPLPEKDFYHPEIVYDVIFDAEELATDSVRRASRQLFLQAIDLYRNKKDATQAIALFKKSILMFPDAKTYYELGNALLDKQAYPEVLKAFEVAEYLHFKPEANIRFGKALANSRLNKESKQVNPHWFNHELYQAFEAGFTDTLQVFQYPTLRQDYLSEDFQRALAQMKISKVKETSGNMLSLFLASFQKVKQPFEIPVEKVEMKEFRQSISYDFAPYVPEMQNTSFGRDVSHDFFYVANVAQTPAFTAVLYASVSFYEEDMQPVMTKLVTLDPAGKVISNLLFSCQCSAEKVKKGKIENNLITLSDFKRTWKYPIDQVGFDKNQVLTYAPLATATFRITDTGKIVEEQAPEPQKQERVIAALN